jgi:hypothetical protein
VLSVDANAVTGGLLIVYDVALADRLGLWPSLQAILNAQGLYQAAQQRSPQPGSSSRSGWADTVADKVVGTVVEKLGTGPLPGTPGQDQLPFPKQAMEAVRDITLLDQAPGYSLHAKTGWGSQQPHDLGWWASGRAGVGQHQRFSQPDHLAHIIVVHYFHAHQAERGVVNKDFFRLVDQMVKALHQDFDQIAFVIVDHAL